MSASNSAQWIYSYNDPKADYRIGRAAGGVDIGYAVSRFSEVRAGYEIGYLDASLKLGTPQFPSVKGQVGASRFLFTTDHLDDPIVPRRGYLGEIDFPLGGYEPGSAHCVSNSGTKNRVFQSHLSAGFCFPVRSGRVDPRL